ncbi:hypothetical protein, partial [Kribbella sp.]|uniref:hypothetical protein n=1 Tax=Kribbella sp. TaxID=1871183 RepID=UPI002D666809
MRAAELHRIHAGTNTINYQVVDDTGRSWFAKLYQGNLNREREAIDLTAYAGHAVPVPALQRTLNGDPIAALPRTTHSEPAAAVPPTVAGELIADAPRTAHGEPVPDAPRTTHGEPVDDAPRTDPGEPVAAGPRTAHGEPVDDAPHTAHGEPVDAAPRTAHGEPVTAAPRTAHGEPVDGVPRTVDGELVVGRLAMSLWEFVDGETAEGGITGARWPAVGNMLGRLHRRLSEHPRAAPTLRPATEVRDMVRARRSFDELIARFTARDELSPFEAWACEAAQERRALLG